MTAKEKFIKEEWRILFDDKVEKTGSRIYDPGQFEEMEFPFKIKYFKEDYGYYYEVRVYPLNIWNAMLDNNNNWTSIEERLPTKNMDCFLVINGVIEKGEWCNEMEGFYIGLAKCYPTHYHEIKPPYKMPIY